jgi:hypothetical protein
VGRAVLGAALAALLFGVPATTRAAVDCRGDVRAEFRRDEFSDQYVDKIFLVEVSSSEPCAKVYFDLVTTERLFNGEEITATRRDWRKSTAEVKASPVKYRMARDSQLVKWEVKMVRCVVCGTE